MTVPPTAMQPITLPSPSRVGQATAIEQSRAVAEVHAAIFVAQQFPRDERAAIRTMRESCDQFALAERAFFRYPRGGETITDASVHLARELARIWGNIQHGVTELDRDDLHGRSEMLAFAWDVQTNARSSSGFISPHKRDTKKGVVDLTDMRDVYENNANQGARRLRQMIFSVLPPWFTEEAKAICRKTLENGGGKPLAQRVIEAIDGFASLGVSEAQLARKLGTAAADWTPHDVAQLGVIYTSLRNGEISKDDEFPDAGDRVTAADVVNGAATKPDEAKARSGNGRQPVTVEGRTPPPADGDRPPAHAASGQVSKIQGHWERLGFEGHEADEVMVYTAQIAGRDEVASFTDLTQEQAAEVISMLAKFKTRPSLVAWLGHLQPGPEAPGDAE